MTTAGLTIPRVVNTRRQQRPSTNTSVIDRITIPQHLTHGVLMPVSLEEWSRHLIDQQIVNIKPSTPDQLIDDEHMQAVILLSRRTRVARRPNNRNPPTHLQRNPVPKSDRQELI